MNRLAWAALVILSAIVLSSCSAISPSSSANWAYGFVVWNGDIFEDIKEEVAKDAIEQSIGEVKKYSDHEGTYGNGYSNLFKKGTKLYKIQGVDTEQFIAAESDGKYFKLKDNGKYGK
ncbi:hypothetical protein ACFOLF_25340 [Paenibacillus sepulcri]|uniref:Lipoprotein n=1 Tax=Paenibacillus sepulcri TaxID=359917 RepID=A0ABS7C7F0_9BACL|nr:hypothetical protein [Paenibacillus sepulcri]